ncbi:MAG TPA: hypothetical protein DFR83_20875 [Deltaproteobacteria bacterium]|nr:hypothetical protein [Deltaproteobacteria bacterium]
MQSAHHRPELTLQRKAAISNGAVLDHAGHVRIQPMADFDLDRTIFQTLEGALPRMVMAARVGKAVSWQEPAASKVEADYARIDQPGTLPPVDQSLLTFMVEQCDFDVEHADGSFLDHLYFCYEYTARHYPQGSALVMLLHSILGTGTNTFAMTPDKIPSLQALVGAEDWPHIEAFPSVLRLLYAGGLREKLWERLDHLDSLVGIRMHRVIDNAPLELTAEQFWTQLNYQLIHLVDFMPVANWSAHRGDTSFIIFRDLFDLMERAGRRAFALDYQPPHGARRLAGESTSIVGWLATRIPVALAERMAARSVQTYSERIGHDLSYQLLWSSESSP